MHPTVHRWLVISVWVLTPSAGFAGDRDWPVERAAAQTKFTYSADLLKSVPVEFLRDAPACFLYSGTAHTLERDGTLHARTHELIRLNNRRGIDQMGEYQSIAFNPSYEKVVLHTARVHKTNGSTTDVAPRHVHIRDTNTDHQVYDACKQVVISFPDLEIGDVIDVCWTVTGRHPEFQDQFFYRYTFGNEKWPVARDEWSVRLPKDRTLRFESVNGAVPVATTEDGSWRQHSWRVDNRPPQPIGEKQPSAEESKLQVACSTFDSWEAVHQWEKRLLAGRCDCPADVKKLVAGLTRDVSKPADKARILSQWVRAHIRYVSRGEKHEYTPHEPTRTFGDRCGDCKDSAHLLALMLREAGLTAGVATLGPRGDGQVIESLPSPWGTHALVAVTIDGQDHWIDTTAQRIGWDVLPRDDRDRLCFITDPSGIRVARTPKLLPADQRTEVATTVTIASNGDATGEREFRYFGLAAWNKRDDLADASTAERRTLIAADLQDAFANGKLLDLRFEGLDDGDAPLVVRLTFACPELFHADGPALEARFGDPALLAGILGATPNPERTAAMEAGEPAEYISRWTLRLPAVYRLASELEGHEVSTRWGRASTSARVAAGDPRRIDFESAASFGDLRIAPDEFAAWKGFQDVVQLITRPVIALKPTRDAADAPALEALLAKTPDDARAAVALAEIYLDQKKKDDARRVLARVCAAAPTDRRLWELNLAAAEDLIDEEQLIRQAVKQFPDDARYVLQLGQNLADQERPQDACAALEPLTQDKSAKIRAEALIVLAHCSLALDEPKKALRHLEAARQADPDGFSADAWFLMGEACEAAGKQRQAIDAYRRSIEDDDALDALAALTRLCTAEGMKAEAIGYLRRLAAQISDDAGERAKVADFAVRLGRFEEAFDLASQARTEGAGLHPLAHRPLGLALFHRKDYGAAADQLSKAEADAETLSALVHALMAEGRLTEAESHLPRFVSIEPTAESRKGVAQVQSVARRRDSLLKELPKEIATTGAARAAADRVACAEAVFDDGHSPELIDRLLDPHVFSDVPIGAAFGLRAVIAAHRGRLGLAMRDADRAIQLSPSQANGFRARGRVRLERNQPGAIEDLERAAELTGRNDAGVLSELAYGYFTVGRLPDAIAVQREAIKIKPEVSTYTAQLREFERLAPGQTKNPG